MLIKPSLLTACCIVLTCCSSKELYLEAFDNSSQSSVNSSECLSYSNSSEKTLPNSSLSCLDSSDYDSELVLDFWSKGVAFGTSITYRGDSYLPYLEEKSLIEFDNQGMKSAVIKGCGDDYDILNIIKNYKEYSDKRVAIIEGFVNDWYQGSQLGTCADLSFNSVCGCIKNSIDYIRSQNNSIRIFLILDHFGRKFGNYNCEGDALNSIGLTQLVYYEEIVKLAENNNVFVVKEYELSEINGNENYLLDDIHLNKEGAVLFADMIWSAIRIAFS